MAMLLPTSSTIFVLLVSLKPGGDDTQGIGTGRQAGKDIDSGAVAFGVVLNLGRHVGDGDGGILDHGSGGIQYGALHVGGSSDLGYGTGGEQHQRRETKSAQPAPEDCHCVGTSAPHRSLQRTTESHFLWEEV